MRKNYLLFVLTLTLWHRVLCKEKQDVVKIGHCMQCLPCNNNFSFFGHSGRCKAQKTEVSRPHLLFPALFDRQLSGTPSENNTPSSKTKPQVIVSMSLPATRIAIITHIRVPGLSSANAFPKSLIFLAPPTALGYTNNNYTQNACF